MQYNAYIKLGEPTRTHDWALGKLGFETTRLKSRITFWVDGFVDEYDLGRNIDEAVKALTTIASQRWVLTYKGRYLLNGKVITGMDLIRQITASKHNNAFTCMVVHPGKSSRR